MRYCWLEWLDRELFVYFQQEKKLEKLELRNLTSTRVSNRIIPPSDSPLFVRPIPLLGRPRCSSMSIRPISLLILSLLRLLDSKFPGNYVGLRIPPLQFKMMLESNPLKSIILVQRLAVQHTHACILLKTAPATGDSLIILKK